MSQGELLAIHMTGRKRGSLESVTEVEAVAGSGLRGDRYFRQEGIGKPEQEVTLIESEALEAVAREHGITLAAAQSRRNLLTRGVSLNALVGQEFSVGDVRLRGIELCEPCGHLEKLTVGGIKKALRGRGGLRAQVVRGGVLRIGDIVARDGSATEAVLTG
ncbi:MAG: MOSC domain-containing protein [Gemmataceae bacterium]|nr:MOSC domain-containing protein [Gemmataceae bacterium]